MPLSRRTFLAAAPLLLTAQTSARAPAPDLVNHELRYRGFVMNLSAAERLPNFVALVEAMRHQFDIVADCGARPEILAVFRSTRVALLPIAGFRASSGGGGNFTPARGAEINATEPPPNNPVVLHELLHALHHRYLPQSNDNPDIERFYRIAVERELYPRGEYLLTNRNEFFAMTGSVYLWGAAARAPNNRETLRAKQPNYYVWLGELFGVKK
jgi:hypothetical protein